MGLHTSRAFTRESGADAEEATRRGIARIVSEGDELRRIDNGASVHPTAPPSSSAEAPGMTNQERSR